MARRLVRGTNIALVSFYRRMVARPGGRLATAVLAREPGAWFWRVMIKGADYIEKGLAEYNAMVVQSKQWAHERLTSGLGEQLLPIAQAA